MGKLTDEFCDSAEGPQSGRRSGYVIHYDTAVKGFGLRVTQNCAKSFILNYRADGIERRYTIGTFRDPWRTAAARREAQRLKIVIDQGGDPQGEKNTVRTAPTVRDLVQRWREEHSPKNRPSTQRENEKLIRQWIFPELGTHRVADLGYADIEALHRKITGKQGTPYRANRVLALVSKMLSLAVRWEWRPDNPCRGIERNHEERRYRYLTPAELERLVAALALYPNQTAANAIRLLLLTGARSGEVFTARWQQFNLEAGVWTKPSSATKQAEPRASGPPLRAGAAAARGNGPVRCAPLPQARHGSRGLARDLPAGRAGGFARARSKAQLRQFSGVGGIVAAGDRGAPGPHHAQHDRPVCPPL
jgi:hypothetical protein